MGRRRLFRGNESGVRDRDWTPSVQLRDAVEQLGRQWSRDRPDIRDDLVQEALLAVWLKRETEAPLNHQLRTARNRILSVRKLGRSVDGKLDSGYKRPRTHVVVSLDEKVSNHDGHAVALRDLLLSPFKVEAYTIDKLTFGELLSVLDLGERRCVILLCVGYTTRDVAKITGYQRASITRSVIEARNKLAPLLTGKAYRIGADPASAITACMSPNGG